MISEEYDFQIIANFLAGKGEAKTKLELLKKFLKDRNLTFRSLEIEKPTLISRIPSDGRISIKKGVICVGGDGTVSETVGYILNNKISVPMAVIPTGTANIIASTLKFSKSDNFGFLLGNKVIKVDIGVAEFQNERDYFLLGLGLGFEENFLKLTKEKLKGKLGIFSYIFAALSELLSLRRIPLIIKNLSAARQDLKLAINVDVCLLAVLNLQPLILKYFPIFKDKNIKANDKIFNIYFVEYKNYLYALIGTLFFHLLGKHNFGMVRNLSGEEFLLDSPALTGTQVDGELRSKLPVKLNFYPSPISFLR